MKIDPRKAFTIGCCLAISITMKCVEVSKRGEAMTSSSSAEEDKMLVYPEWQETEHDVATPFSPVVNKTPTTSLTAHP